MSAQWKVGTYSWKYKRANFLKKKKKSLLFLRKELQQTCILPQQKLKRYCTGLTSSFFLFFFFSFSNPISVHLYNLSCTKMEEEEEKTPQRTQDIYYNLYVLGKSLRESGVAPILSRCHFIDLYYAVWLPSWSLYLLVL